MTKKAIVVCSGGLDSTVLLQDCLNKLSDVSVISFKYGSKHNRFELKKSEQICKILKVKRQVIDLTNIFENLNSTLLIGGGKIPKGHYNDENMKQTVISFRNGIFLSIGVAIADNIGADTIFYGAHFGDHTIYPDCRKKFVDAMNEASKLGTYNKVKIMAPFWKKSKGDIVKLGKKLGVNFSMTHTCYSPKTDGRPCGKCGSCNERVFAFVENKIQDPLYSENRWNKILESIK